MVKYFIYYRNIVFKIKIRGNNATWNKGSFIILNPGLPINNLDLRHIPQDCNYKHYSKWVPENSEPNMSAVHTSPVTKILFFVIFFLICPFM